MELLGKLEHQRQETQLLLDNQRGHMIQREAMLQASIQQLKEDLALVSQQVSSLQHSHNAAFVRVYARLRKLFRADTKGHGYRYKIA